MLADYLIHDRSELENKTVLELGAGVGLTSAVAGIYAKQIICTGDKSSEQKKSFD